jgi:alpha-tubulin suppressor-like RCC1 family protein
MFSNLTAPVFSSPPRTDIGRVGSPSNLNLTWGAVPSATYELEYREVGTTRWFKTETLNTNNYTIQGKHGVTYEFRTIAKIEDRNSSINLTESGNLTSGGSGLTLLNTRIPFRTARVEIQGAAYSVPDRLFIRSGINNNIRYTNIIGGRKDGLPDTGMVSGGMSLSFDTRLLPDNPTEQDRIMPLAVEGSSSGTVWDIYSFTITNLGSPVEEIKTYFQTSQISTGTAAPTQPIIGGSLNEQNQPVITITPKNPDTNYTDFDLYYRVKGMNSWILAATNLNSGELLIDFLQSDQEYELKALTRLQVMFNNNPVSIYSVDSKGDLGFSNIISFKIPPTPRNPVVDKCNSTISNRPVLKSGFSINNYFSLINGAYSVTVGSRIDDYGIPDTLIDYGHYYSEQPNLLNRRREDLFRVPTSSRTKSSSSNNIYESTINGLKPETTYYVIGFVRNNTGWGYSCNELSFTTPRLELPKFGDLIVKNISCSGAEFISSIIDQGFPPLTKKGVQFSTTRSFGTSTITLTSTQTGDSYSNVTTRLSPNTTYWVRSFAESPAGKSYSEPVEFRTLSFPVFDDLPKCPYNDMTLATPLSSITKYSATATSRLKSFGSSGNHPTQHGHVWKKGRTTPTFKDKDGITDFGVLNHLNPFTSYLGDGKNAPRFKEISCGNGFCVAITVDGYLVTWGRQDHFAVSDTPSESGYLQVSCGNLHATAIKEDGRLVSWGNYPENIILYTPSSVGFKKVTSGNGFCVGLRLDGTLVSWGRTSLRVITDTPKGNDFIDISCGSNYCLAIKSDGSLVTWGTSLYSLETNSPTGNDFIKIGAGGKNASAIKTDKTIVSWGSNFYGEVSNTPTDQDYSKVSWGFEHCTALKLDGTLVSWGRNINNVVSNTPIENGFVDVSCGNGHCTALKDDGTLLSWGSNLYQQIHTTPNYHYELGDPLEMASRYVVKPYAIHGCGITYGESDVFWTAGLRPKVVIKSINEITQTSVIATGGVLDLGVPNPFDHGFVYSSQMVRPRLNAVLIKEGIVRNTRRFAKNDYNDFSSEIKNLQPGTTYYIRAYLSNTSRPSKNTGVTNSGATTTVYSDVLVFTTEKSDSQKLNEALEKLTLPNVCFISEDLSLPTQIDEATITWTSSLPHIISNEGIVYPPPYTERGIRVTLTARITVGDFTRFKFFNVVVKGTGEFQELIDLENGFESSLCASNWGTRDVVSKIKVTEVDFNGANNQYLLWTMGQEYDVVEKRFPLKHHSGDIRCSWRVSDDKVKIRKWLPMDLTISFNENTATIVINPDPLVSLSTGRKTIIHLGSLDQMKNAQQTDIRGNFGGFSGSDIPSETPIDSYGEVAGNGNTDVLMVYTRGIRPYAKHEIFLEDTDTSKIIIKDNLSSSRGTFKNILLMPNYNGIDGETVLITDSETEQEERYIFYNITIPVTPFEGDNIKIAIKEDIKGGGE